ncbi:MAG TPA: hypothetical protein VIZ22_14120 [Candidatus Limnocylindrales bacterium]
MVEARATSVRLTLARRTAAARTCQIIAARRLVAALVTKRHGLAIWRRPANVAQHGVRADPEDSRRRPLDLRTVAI